MFGVLTERDDATMKSHCPFIVSRLAPSDGMLAVVVTTVSLENTEMTAHIAE